jgi:hypothetical protein
MNMTGRKAVAVMSSAPSSASSKRAFSRKVPTLRASGWSTSNAELNTKRRTPASLAAESRLTLPRYSTSSASRPVPAESAEKTPAQPSRADAKVSGFVTSPITGSAPSERNPSPFPALRARARTS